MKKYILTLLLTFFLFNTIQSEWYVKAEDENFPLNITKSLKNTSKYTPLQIVEMNFTDKNGNEFDEETSDYNLSTTIETKSLPFTASSHGQKQINNHYCGPAAARAVIKYLTGKSYTQTYIAPYVGQCVGGSGTSWTTMGSGINKIENLRYGWSNINTTGRGIASVVRRNIVENRPVIAHVGLPELDPSYYNSGNINFDSAHYIVIIGYSFGYDTPIPYKNTEDGNFSTQSPYNTITYYDPFRHKVITAPYSRVYNAMKACQPENQVLIW